MDQDATEVPAEQVHQEETKDPETLKRLRFIAIKGWEDKRVQTSSIYRNIITQIHKKVSQKVEQSQDVVSGIIAYFKDRVQRDQKYIQPINVTIPENEFTKIMNPIMASHQLLQSQIEQYCKSIETEVIPILQNDLQTVAQQYNQYKTQIAKRVAQIESLIKTLNSNYKEYGKMYIEQSKLTIKGKEPEKDLYISELPYLVSVFELHTELKAYAKDTIDFVEQQISADLERQGKIKEVLKIYHARSLEFKQLPQHEEILLLLDFTPTAMTIDQVLVPQDANYIQQSLGGELNMDLVKRYIFEYKLEDPHPNQIIIGQKLNAQYAKNGKIKDISIVVTVDKSLIIHTHKPLFILSAQHVTVSYEKDEMKIVESKKGLIGMNKTKILVKCSDEFDTWDDHEVPDDFGFSKEEVSKIDLFTLKNFELPKFPRQEQIKQLAVSGHMFIIITRANNIYRWRPAIEDECQLLELPEQVVSTKLFGQKKEKREVVLDRVFVRGHHAIISSDGGENYYINCRDTKIKFLEQLKGKNIKAIAWNELMEEFDTAETLLSTKDSRILSYRIECKNDLKEYEAKQMVQIPQERQINQIEYFTLQIDGQKYGCVVVSTNFSIYYFYGVNSLEILFQKYKDPEAIKRAESPSTRSHTSLLALCYSRGPKARANSFLYTNGKALNLYQLPERDVNESILTQVKQLQTSQQGYDIPIQIGLTEFHYLLLSADGLNIISRITELSVQKYELRQMGHILGMQYDPDNEVYWVYSEKAVQKVDVSNEDKDIWKLLLDKKMYLQAYEICQKYDSPYTRYIAGLCGDQYFKEGKFSNAAQYYQRSSMSFEEIFLKFVCCDDYKARVGLESYLKELMNSLKGEQERTLVLAWRTELLIYRLNETERKLNEIKPQEGEINKEKIQRQNQQLLKDLKDEVDNFLKTYQKELPEELSYQIMQSHGRIENCVEFAKLNNNYEMIILHHINEENYKEALKNLKSVKDKNSMEVIQKYSHILMKHEPEATLQLLITQIKKFDPTKIIGGLMNIPMEKRNAGIQFLEHSINKLGCTEKSINNLLIFFLTQPPQKEKLNDYLQQQEQLLMEKEKVNFELDFALRLFQQASLIDAQIMIYGMMGLYQESVQLSLDYNFIDKAKEYANKPIDDDKKKKLWMLIAERLLRQNEPIDRVIDLTKQTDLIKIEDLLPHFNENIKIEHFKDEICNSLKMYNEEIEKLKEEMKKLSQNSDQLKNELKMTKNKFLIIDTQQKCESCTKQLFNDTFYIFPCNHGFHKDCLVIKIRQQPQNAQKMQKIESLDSKMSSILQKGNNQLQQGQKKQDGTSFFQLMNIFGGAKQEQRQQSSLSAEEEKILKDTKEEFDLLVASECIYCGPSVVDSIQIGFEIDVREKELWSL